MPSSRAIAMLMLVSSSSAVAQGGPAPAPAATWPDRPIRLIAPVSPGGGGDFSARLLAK